MAVQLCSGKKMDGEEERNAKYFKLKSKKLFWMILLYIFFLLAGAAVFNYIEQRAEVKVIS